MWRRVGTYVYPHFTIRLESSFLRKLFLRVGGKRDGGMKERPHVRERERDRTR